MHCEERDEEGEVEVGEELGGEGRVAKGRVPKGSTEEIWETEVSYLYTFISG